MDTDRSLTAQTTNLRGIVAVREKESGERGALAVTSR
jgi:hypothetical protein